jgi:hypothetical protein
LHLAAAFDGKPGKYEALLSGVPSDVVHGGAGFWLPERQPGLFINIITELLPTKSMLKYRQERHFLRMSAGRPLEDRSSVLEVWAFADSFSRKRKTRIEAGMIILSCAKQMSSRELP